MATNTPPADASRGRGQGHFRARNFVRLTSRTLQIVALKQYHHGAEMRMDRG